MSQADLNALEREVEQTRARFANDLARLRSPRNLASGFEQLRAPPELRLWLASFPCMTNFVFDPPLRLARDVTVRTLDDAAEFARTFVGPRLPHRRDRLVRRLQEVSDNASARIAARSFRAWAITEGLLAEET
jgi:hypothetical protein